MKIKQDTELRLCLGCVASAAGYEEVVLGPGARCCKRVDGQCGNVLVQCRYAVTGG